MAEAHRNYRDGTRDSAPRSDARISGTRGAGGPVRNRQRSSAVRAGSREQRISSARTRNAQVIRRKTPSISDDFNATREDQTTQADLTRTPQDRQKRITRVDINNSSTDWEGNRDGAEYASVSDDYRGIQNARTTRAQLQDERWDGTKPRDLPREERIRRVNARKKEGLLRKTARSRAIQHRIPKIHAAGKGELAQKLAAKFIFRWTWVAAGYITPILLISFILMLVGIFIAEQNVLDGIKKIPEAFQVEGMSLREVFIRLAFTFGAMGVGILNLLNDIIGFLTDFNIAVAIAFAFWFLGAGIGIMSLLIIFLMFKSVPIGIHPIGGEKSGIKYLLFISALTLHAFPLTFFAPWFLVWAWYVSRHPA